MIGKCNCGSVSFEVAGKFPALYHCHCTLCQKQGGTGSNAATMVYAKNFQWISGEEKIQRWQKDTGFSSHFCSGCGSPVPNVFKAKYVWVPVGLMEGVGSEVKVNLWLSSTPDWAKPEEFERNYDAAPDDIEEFVQFLNADGNV